jgi:RNA polymerase sigma factor (sigma-70 family)
VDKPTVYIIDDDPAVLDSLVLLLGLQGYATRPFSNADAFLDAWSVSWRGCVVLDLRMPGKSGLELQREMIARGITLPIVMITAHGDVSAARASLKSGAVDFLEKPLDNAQLINAVRAALARDERERARARGAAELQQQIERLTPREREVLDGVLAGRHNREIAAALGISARTVEVYKARVMAKLGVERVPELVRRVLQKSQ